MSSRVYEYIAMLCLLLFVAIIAVVFDKLEWQSNCEQRSAIEIPRCKK